MTSNRKRGESEVDVEFLKEIDGWRDVLARNMALRNRGLSAEDLNAAVQSTIDRVVFLRMAEDRGLEPRDQLLRLSEQPEIYSRFMRDVCRKADAKYNSGLLHFQQEEGIRGKPDRVTPNLSVDDDVFKPILQRLYVAHGSSCCFGVLPVEILGTVYERILGEAIRLTPSRRARVKQRRKTRKAGGVYYTPPDLVEQVVRHTVGRQIEGKSPSQLAGGNGEPPLRVLDMACGSGVFLLGAYQYLLNYCLNWYVEHDPATHTKAVCKSPCNDRWLLSMDEKWRILTTHVFGVDIDPQAVGITRLSLLLKMFEGDAEQRAGRQMGRFHGRALRNLAENVRCGNALVGPDFFTGRLPPDGDEWQRINPFDWRQGFPEAMKTGGFDCVIGNPPWGQKEIVKDQRAVAYLKRNYPSVQSGIFDLFRPFTEAAIRHTRAGGSWGFVLPDIVLLKSYPQTRAFILENVALSAVAFWGMAFADAVIDAVTIVGRREPCEQARRQSPIEVVVREKTNGTTVKTVRQAVFADAEEFKFNLFADEGDRALLEKLRRWPTFSSLCEPHEGVHSGNMREKLFLHRKKNRFCVPMILGREEVQRYRLSWQGRFLDLTPGIVDRENGEYANLGRPEWFAQPKLVIRRTGDRLVCCLDADGYYFSNNVFVAPRVLGTVLDLHYLLGLLNSKLMTWFYTAIQPRKGRVFAEVKIKHIQQFPVRPIDLSNRRDQRAHQRMLSLVDSMLALQEQCAAAKTETHKADVQRHIGATDAAIDRLVYDLYELTDDEIARVERATA